MSTETTLKPKKKFSTGGVLCLVTALVVALFGIFDLAEVLVDAIIEVAEIARYDYFKYDSDYFIYIYNLVFQIRTVILSVCALVVAFTLAALGVLLLFKVNSKLIGLISGIPIVASIVSVITIMATILLRTVMLSSYSVLGISWGNILLWIFFDVINVIPYFVMVLCWVALGICIIIFGGKKKPIDKKGILPIVMAALISLLFGGMVATEFIGVLIFSLYEAVYLLISVGNWLRDLDYLLECVVWPIVGSGFKCGILGIAYVPTMFFAVRWIIAPYKKAE